MKIKNKAALLFIVSVMIIILDFKSFKNMSDFITHKYVEENLIKEKYTNEDYNFVVETEHGLNFLKGNSLVKLGDNYLRDQNKESAIKNYRAALDFYKLAVEQKDEINIKKNYEITLNKIDKLENEKQEEQKENQEQQQEQKQEEQDKQEDSKNQNESQEQKDSSEEKKSDSSKNKNEDQQNDQKQQDQQEQSKLDDAQKNKNEQAVNTENSAVNTEEKISEQELQYILEKLEINEKQAFKNNERFINQNNEENSKKW
ncbi:MAG: hypothetical protein ACRC6A_08745 [Fusobacteriaceae bacterium]